MREVLIGEYRSREGIRFELRLAQGPFHISACYFYFRTVLYAVSIPIPIARAALPPCLLANLRLSYIFLLEIFKLANELLRFDVLDRRAGSARRSALRVLEELVIRDARLESVD